MDAQSLADRSKEIFPQVLKSRVGAACPPAAGYRIVMRDKGEVEEEEEEEEVQVAVAQAVLRSLEIGRGRGEGKGGGKGWQGK